MAKNPHHERPNRPPHRRRQGKSCPMAKNPHHEPPKQPPHRRRQGKPCPMAKNPHHERPNATPNRHPTPKTPLVAKNPRHEGREGAGQPCRRPPSPHQQPRRNPKGRPSARTGLKIKPHVARNHAPHAARAPSTARSYRAPLTARNHRAPTRQLNDGIDDASSSSGPLSSTCAGLRMYTREVTRSMEPWSPYTTPDEKSMMR